MPSILLVVFVLQLVIHLVNTVGVSVINAILWDIYNRLPTSTAKGAAEQRRLQKEFLRLRRELNATSSQDEFAKWAKLRRQHDKVLEQLEKTKASVDSAKTQFDTWVSRTRWLGTNGLRFVLQWYYAKVPMFWLPAGVFPYFAEWLLSFPRAPLGSISIQTWVLACGAVILLVSDAIIGTASLVMEMQVRRAQRTKEKPMKFSGEKFVGGKSEAEKGETKKEL